MVFYGRVASNVSELKDKEIPMPEFDRKKNETLGDYNNRMLDIWLHNTRLEPTPRIWVLEKKIRRFLLLPIIRTIAKLEGKYNDHPYCWRFYYNLIVPEYRPKLIWSKNPNKIKDGVVYPR